ncbi:MAG: hypothetical protein ACOCQD_00410 [archaeon]
MTSENNLPQNIHFNVWELVNKSITHIEKLDDLKDVSIENVGNGEVLQYKEGIWKNIPISISMDTDIDDSIRKRFKVELSSNNIDNQQIELYYSFKNYKDVNFYINREFVSSLYFNIELSDDRTIIKWENINFDEGAELMIEVIL